jgi:DNA-binding response OmpR family regulator
MLADVGHIVVVDDDPALRQMVTRYLEEHNIPTKSASNRTELTAILKRRIPVRSFAPPVCPDLIYDRHRGSRLL